MGKPRIVILTNVIAPYRLDFFRRICKENIYEAHFLLFGDKLLEKKGWSFSSHSGIRAEKLPGVLIGGIAWNPTLRGELRRLRPDLIVCGGASTQAFEALRYSEDTGTPMLMWWGGTKESEKPTSSLKDWWRRWLFSRADGFFAYSSLSADHIRVMGSRKPIYILGNNTMNCRSWHERVAHAGGAERGLKPIVLCIGQLIERKNYSLALKVFSRLSARGIVLPLILVGSGPLERALREQARDLGITERIRFVGEASHEELPNYFARARVFLHPARLDQWPQVINEAMAAGLPIILSCSSGVPSDFAQDGVNCFVRDPDDETGWEHCLKQLASDEKKAQQLGQSAFLTAMMHDLEFALDEFNRGITEMLDMGFRRVRN